MGEAIYVFMLVLLSIEDIKYRAVRLWHLVVMMLVLWGINISIDKFDIRNVVIAVAIGVVLLGYCIITDSMGIADGIIFMQTGIFMGVVFAFKVFILAIVIMCGITVFKYILKYIIKYKIENMESSKVPFIPYILAGAVGVMLLG